MTRDEIKGAIDFFFEVVDKDPPGTDLEAKLALALDKLALGVHFAVCTFDENEYPDAPRRDYQRSRELVSPRFPDCGYYNVAYEISEKVAESSTGVGDAIDDICDIAGDLQEVLWRWHNTSVDDALWHFKDGFQFHWGKHLRDLQLYLYAKRNGW